MSIRTTGSPCSRPREKTTAHRTKAVPARTRPSPASRRCNGVRGSPGWASAAAIRPRALSGPVAVTTNTPRPRVTVVPADIAAAGPVPAVLSTGTDSPVSADSSTCNAAPSTSHPSAGTMSPASTTTTSPGTICAAGTCCWAPPRTTRAVGAVSSLSAASARSARISCTTPTVVFSTITARMTIVSCTSRVSVVRVMAPSSTRMSGSRNCVSTRCHHGRRGGRGGSLRPYRSRRRRASTGSSPRRGYASATSPGAGPPTGPGCAGETVIPPKIGSGSGRHVGPNAPDDRAVRPSGTPGGIPLAGGLLARSGDPAPGGRRGRHGWVADPQ